MTGLFRPRYSFLTNNSWQTQALNALKYNTSQVGSVVPMIYGTCRQQVNLIGFADYRGPSGKKGKGNSPLPIGGTNQAGKGGGGGKKGGKKSPDYSVDVDFGICEGPVSVQPNNGVYSSGEAATISSLPLNFYGGQNGQAVDGTMADNGLIVGYSGTCHITATPMDLGPSPVLPNLGFEINGFLYGTMGALDADPAQVIEHFLTDPQRGAGFPLVNLDTTNTLPSLSVYCSQIGFSISTILDAQQSGLEWLSGFLRVLNCTMVWSGDQLTFWPWAEQTIGIWEPNLVAQYALDDRDFLFERQAIGGDIVILNDDPVTATRTNPTDLPNWYSMEYTDRNNFYNSTIVSGFDQSSINNYGLRIGDALSGKQFSNPSAAGAAVQTIVQRTQYVLNIFKFKLGWKYSLLEPMDIVLLSGGSGDNYLNRQAVRITSIEEDDNGDLSITGEEVTQGTNHPVSQPGPTGWCLYFPQSGAVAPSLNVAFCVWLNRTEGAYDYSRPNLGEDNSKFSLSFVMKPQRQGMNEDILGAGRFPNGPGGPPLLPPFGLTEDSKLYSSIFAAFGDGLVEWGGYDADGRYLGDTMQAYPITPDHPALVGASTLFPSFAVGYRGDGTMQVQLTSYATGPLALDPYGYPYFNWTPWKLECSLWLFTDGVLNMSGNQWHHVYFGLDLEVSDYAIVVDGGSHDLMVDLFLCWSYLAPVQGALLDPLGENFFFGTVFVYQIGWHVANIGGWMVSNGGGILYYENSVSGCVTDFWWKYGIYLGIMGWEYFYDKYLNSAIYFLGEHGELPLSLSGNTGNADLFYRDIYSDSIYLLPWGGSVNHGLYGNGDIHTDPSDGFAGYTGPELCTDTPWSVSGL